MLDVHLTHHSARSSQVGQNGLVGCPHTLASVLTGQLGQVTTVVHRHGDRHLRILLADVEVVHAVAACGVHTAGTAFQRDVVAQNDPALLGQVDVVVAHQLELSAGNGLAHDLVVLDVAGVHDALDQIGGHDVVLLADLDEGVLELTVQADSLVGGQGPGGGGPDDEIGLIHGDAVLCQNTVRILRDVETHKDRIAVVLAVLDLGFCQRGAAVRAPVHGLEALVDVALLGHLAEDLDLTRFKLRLQGQVGVLEVTDNAQTLELVAHDVDMLGGKLFTDLAQLQLGDVLLFVADRGQSLQLNGQAVGIKAGHIGSLIALHVLFADDDILDDLVQGSAHVDIAVCIRRAVVQNELGLALIVLHELVVQVVVVPILEHDRFLLGQAGTHLEQGLGQIQRTVVLRFVLSQWFTLSSIFALGALLAELDALKSIIVRLVRLHISRRRVQLELAFVLCPEILAAVSRLVVIGRGGRFGGFGRFGRLLGRSCCSVGCRGSIRLCGGLLCGSLLRRLCVLCGGVLCSFLGFLLELRQTAQRLHMAAVQVEHIRLEAGLAFCSSSLASRMISSPRRFARWMISSAFWFASRITFSPMR